MVGSVKNFLISVTPPEIKVPSICFLMSNFIFRYFSMLELWPTSKYLKIFVIFFYRVRRLLKFLIEGLSWYFYADYEVNDFKD